MLPNWTLKQQQPPTPLTLCAEFMELKSVHLPNLYPPGPSECDLIGK